MSGGVSALGARIYIYDSRWLAHFRWRFIEGVASRATFLNGFFVFRVPIWQKVVVRSFGWLLVGCWLVFGWLVSFSLSLYIKIKCELPIARPRRPYVNVDLYKLRLIT